MKYTSKMRRYWKENNFSKKYETSSKTSEIRNFL